MTDILAILDDAKKKVVERSRYIFEIALQVSSKYEDLLEENGITTEIIPYTLRTRDSHSNIIYYENVDYNCPNRTVTRVAQLVIEEIGDPYEDFPNETWRVSIPYELVSNGKKEDFIAFFEDHFEKDYEFEIASHNEQKFLHLFDIKPDLLREFADVIEQNHNIETYKDKMNILRSLGIKVRD